MYLFPTSSNRRFGGVISKPKGTNIYPNTAFRIGFVVASTYKLDTELANLLSLPIGVV